MASIFNTAEAPILIENDFNADPANRDFNGAMDDICIYKGVAADDASIKNIYDATILRVNDNVVKTLLNVLIKKV
jgi:hypothetical protein